MFRGAGKPEYGEYRISDIPCTKWVLSAARNSHFSKEISGITVAKFFLTAEEKVITEGRI